MRNEFGSSGILLYMYYYMLRARALLPIVLVAAQGSVERREFASSYYGQDCLDCSPRVVKEYRELLGDAPCSSKPWCYSARSLAIVHC